VDKDAWLALVQEEAIEPDLPICDAHHHFWDQGPWGPYLLPQFQSDVGSGHNIVSTVFVECDAMYRADGPERFRCVGETEFVRGLAAMSASGSYGPTQAARGIISHADLTLGHDVAPVLEAHLEAAPALFRGVRHTVTADIELSTRLRAGMLGEPGFRDGVYELGRLGLIYESYLYHPQIPELIDLARAFPTITIVLDHMGGPIGIMRYAGHLDVALAEWKKSIDELASVPNVVMKLGGLNMPVNGFGWHKRDRPPTSEEIAEANRPWVSYVIERLGVDRCMFESNFPVERRNCSYVVLWNAFKRMISGASAAEKRALLHDTASRVYRISA
jgi:predicted TIM-barrel fold metal-dependent hydrolase